MQHNLEHNDKSLIEYMEKYKERRITKMNNYWFIPVAVVLAVLLLGLYIASRFRTAKPEQALIVTGAKVQSGLKILRSGGAFVWPVIQRAEYLSLQVHTLEVSSTEVYTTDGIPVIVNGIAQIKIKGDLESISVAAEHFLGKQAEAVAQVAVQSLEGYLRAVLVQLSMDSVYKNRDEFAGKVRELAESDLKKMGLQIVAFTIRDVKDKMGYLDAIGLPQIASLKKDAEIAKAIALRDEQVAKSKALEESQKAGFTVETNIAEAVKEMEVKKTAFLLEREMRKAEAEQSIRLQEIKMMHTLKEEEMTTQIMEKQKLNELEAKELERRENLEASMKRTGFNINEQQLKESEVNKAVPAAEAPKKHGDKADSKK
jgi:flotillin